MDFIYLFNFILQLTFNYNYNQLENQYLFLQFVIFYIV